MLDYLSNLKIIALRIMLFVLFVFLIVPYVYAYIDPGSGSYVVEIVIATLVAGLFAIKIWWGKLRLFLSKRRIWKKNKTD